MNNIITLIGDIRIPIENDSEALIKEIFATVEKYGGKVNGKIYLKNKTEQDDFPQVPIAIQDKLAKYKQS